MKHEEIDVEESNLEEVCSGRLDSEVDSEAADYGIRIGDIGLGGLWGDQF